MRRQDAASITRPSTHRPDGRLMPEKSSTNADKYVQIHIVPSLLGGILYKLDFAFYTSHYYKSALSLNRLRDGSNYACPTELSGI
jgi:hypothetical protein